VAALAAGRRADAADALAAALAAVDALLADRRAAEVGQWSGLWFTDHLSDMQRARKFLRRVQAAAAAPAGAPLTPVTPALWYEFEAYLAPFKQNWPLQHFNAKYNLATYVRCNCVWADVDAGACANSPAGGTFAAGAGAALTLQVMNSATTGPARDGGSKGAGLTIRYTLDGSTPTAASPAYAPGAPIRLDAAAKAGVVTLRALAFDGAGQPAAAQTTDAVYTQRA
jgi:hypothetical protein